MPIRGAASEILRKHERALVKSILLYAGKHRVHGCLTMRQTTFHDMQSQLATVLLAGLVGCLSSPTQVLVLEGDAEAVRR